MKILAINGSHRAGKGTAALIEAALEEARAKGCETELVELSKCNIEYCIGCNRCASVCQCDILLPSPVKGEHPIVAYPGECYYCGACVMVCPRKGAIRLEHPLMNQAKYVPVIPESEVLN